MEKVRLDHINWLLEIKERERNHELLLFMKNLQELGASLFPYIVPVLPRPLPIELVKGERFVLSYLLKLISRGSSQAESALETFVRSDYLPLSAQDPKPAPHAAKKKKKKVGRVKATREGLEWFVDWTILTISKSTEEREVEMSSLATRFAVKMRKRATNTQGEATHDSEGPGGKRSRRSDPEEETQKTCCGFS